ncbi:pilus assembly PilX N-terminal domain-containing protein [Candidatus Parcubacteria bacterium]|nr:pilus assembly PilX N-terminal domain-containing protein [Candidatus Parcubacteria bacterium]
MKIKKNRKLDKDQSGIASMVIVIIIMTILTLVVLAMTQNANREQRQSLDRQLNSQAFYAAESGMNDAKDYIVENPDAAPKEKNDCQPLPPLNANSGDQFPGKSARVSDKDEAIRYSCVMYDQDPATIEFSDLDVNRTEIVPIEDSDGKIIKELTFSWAKTNGGTVFSDCPVAVDLDKFPPQLKDNCEAGMLRVALIDSSGANRQDIINKSFAAYLKPSDQSGAPTPITYGSASGSLERQGAIVAGTCNADACTVKITNINKFKLYMQLRSLYKANKVVISGVTLAGDIVNFSRAQLEVDSTGLANDVLKRIRVRIPLSSAKFDSTGAVLQTTNSICKRLEVIRPDKVTADPSCTP